MSMWKDGEDGSRVIELDSQGHEGRLGEARVELRHVLRIARLPGTDTWRAWLDSLALFTVEASATGDAEVAALAELEQWAYEMIDVIYLVTQDKMPLRPVRCAWCDFVGHSVVPGEIELGTQGDNVASSVWRGNGAFVCNGTFKLDHDRWFVQGGYGSSGFDMELYRFVKNAPTEPADPICDGCIRKRIDAGDLEMITDHVLSGTVVLGKSA